jgi:hypothetical protein
MSARLPIAIIAGAACAFLLPLPQPEAASLTLLEPRAAPSAARSGTAVPASSDHDEPLFLDADTIARMDRGACISALDRLLRGYAASPPALEQQHSATALAVRIFRTMEPQSLTDFPGTRRLPAWLLATTWLTLSEKHPGVPDVLRRALPAMPAGLDAARRIVESLATTDPDAASAFLQSMPGDWRKSLRESCLQGLAATHPLEAARELWKGGTDPRHLAVAATRHGPIEETVQMLAQYREDLGGMEVEAALAVLHARDPASLRKLVEAQGDEKLTAQHARVAARPDPYQHAGRPLSEMLGAAARQPETGTEGAVRAMEQSALHDPAAAIKAWTALEDGALKKKTGEGLLRSLAMHHPAEALAWSEEHAPQASSVAVRDWLSSDAPAALRAILELPYSSVFRQNAVEELKVDGRIRYLMGWDLQREDLLMAAQELPPNLLRQVVPD